MLIAESELENYAAVYNSLNDNVDAAYLRLQKVRHHMKIVRAALSIIKTHGANDYLGVFLLHRHFACQPGTLFVERSFAPKVEGHAPVLVTTPMRLSKAPRRGAPHRFKIASDGTLQPLEFTTDRAVIAAQKRLAAAHLLRLTLGSFLSLKKVSALVGVGIFVRSGDKRKATSVFLEETSFEDEASVVHVLPQLPREPGRLVPTLWTFGDLGNGCCTQQCKSYCHHPSQRIGYCGHRKSGHVGCA